MPLDVDAQERLPREWQRQQRRLRSDLWAAALAGALVSALLLIAWNAVLDPHLVGDDYRLGATFRDATVKSKAARAPLVRECKSMAEAVYGYQLRPKKDDIRTEGAPASERAFYEGCRGEAFGHRIFVDND